MDSHTPAQPPARRALLPLLGILALSVLPVGLYLTYQHSLRCFCRALSSNLGLEVRIARGIWGDLTPALVLAGVEVRLPGDQGAPILQIDRVVVELAWSPRQPALRRVRLIRPALRLSEPELARWLERVGPASPAPRHERSRTRTRTTASRTRLSIEDGSLDLRFQIAGRSLRARSEAIHLELQRASGGAWRSPARLLLGPTRLASAGEPLLELAAVALDLELRRLAPARLAILGGVLRLPAPDGNASAAFTLHSLSILRGRDGAARLELHAKPAGPRSGRIRLRLRLDRDPPPGLEVARCVLDDVDLTRLAPFLDRFGLRLSGTRLSGSLLATRSDAGLRILARLDARDLVLDHRRVAAGPVGPIHARLDGTLDYDREGVSLGPARIALGALGLEAKARLRIRAGGGGATLAAELRMPEAPCQRVLGSLPARFAPALEGMALQGTIGATARLKLDTRDLDAGTVDVSFAPLACRVTADPPAADVRRLTSAVTIRVSGARGAAIDWRLGAENPHYTPLARISAHLRSAFVAAEDSRFFRHQGFDPEQLRRAFLANLKEGKMLRGASTISQQVIKNVFLDHGRNFSRKVQEAVLTWRLEQVVPKQRILELYLNLVEMGPGIYGVGQASRAYFKRPPSEVSRLQAAQLAALTPSPRHLAPRLREGNLGQAWTDKIQTLLRIMRRAQPRPQPLATLTEN